MTTYQLQLENALSEDVIPAYWLGYFRESFREAINDQLLEMYCAASQKGLNKKTVAQKLDRRPEQITRWLAAPNNLEVDTVSDLALAMGCIPVFSLQKITFGTPSQQRHPLTERLQSLTEGTQIFDESPGYVILKANPETQPTQLETLVE